MATQQSITKDLPFWAQSKVMKVEQRLARVRADNQPSTSPALSSCSYFGGQARERPLSRIMKKNSALPEPSSTSYLKTEFQDVMLRLSTCQWFIRCQRATDLFLGLLVSSCRHQPASRCALRSSMQSRVHNALSLKGPS